ncbi:MAG: hypothetical protein E3K32_10270 [wastewater metagenome]|nr:hypothetical protein [Candidatus Loosdrechtia aerotolerans]
MNNLTRYLKIVFIAGFCIISQLFTFLKAYSFDIDEPVLSVTNFLDSLTYDYRGVNIKLLGVSIGETYDDNITFSETDEEEDFVTDISFAVGVSYEGKRNTFGLVGNISSQIFAKNSEFNHVAEDVDLKFMHEFSEQDRINVKNSFYHSEAPLFFRDDFFDEQFQRTDGRFDHYRNRLDIDYQKDISKQITGTIWYGNNINAFSGVDIAASYTNEAGIEADYLLSSLTQFSLSYDFRNIQFENDEDATINTVTAGVRQYITKKIYFDGAVGLDFIDSFEDGEEFTRPLYAASFVYEVSDRTEATVSFTKRDETNPYVSDVFHQWRTSVGFKRQLSERLKCALSAFYGDGEYVFSNFEREFLGGRATLGYDITKNLSGNFTYAYSDLNSNISTAEYEKNTVFLGLVAEF